MVSVLLLSKDSRFYGFRSLGFYVSPNLIQYDKYMKQLIQFQNFALFSVHQHTIRHHTLLCNSLTWKFPLGPMVRFQKILGVSRCWSRCNMNCILGLVIEFCHVFLHWPWKKKPWKFHVFFGATRAVGCQSRTAWISLGRTWSFEMRRRLGVRAATQEVSRLVHDCTWISFIYCRLI